MSAGFDITMLPKGLLDEVPCGFQITFANGVIASVQFSEIHYCSMRTDPDAPASSAECGVFRADASNLEWLRPPGFDDDVRGWMTPEEVVEMLAWAAAQPAVGGAA